MPLLASLRAALAPIALLLACGRGDGADAPPRRPPAPVRVAAAERQDVPRTLAAVGTVLPSSTVAVRPLVAGPIQRVLFTEGDEVRAGQELFRIDAAPYEAALAQARAALARARRLAANARADVRRYAPLRRGGYVSDQQYETALASARSLAAEVAAQAAAARRAELELGRCRVTSPIDGRTGAVLVQAGNVVQPGQAQALVVVTRLRPALVDLRVPEQHVQELRRGLGRMRVDARAGAESRAGVLTFVDNAVDTASGTIRARARFDNADEALWPGQFVEARLQLSVQRGAIVVPSAAVVAGQAGASVFVLQEDGTVEQRRVEVGLVDARRTVIARGVEAGERVVTEGQLNLSPGARAAVAPGRASPGGAQQARRPGGGPAARPPPDARARHQARQP